MIATRTKNVQRTKDLRKQVRNGWASVLPLACAAVLLGSLGQAQTQYRSAEEAWQVGVAFYSSRNFAASREPFEACRSRRAVRGGAAHGAG